VAEGLAAEAERVRHGSTLADALRRVPLLSAGLPAWVQAGEASGSLETLLEMAGRTLQHQWERFVTRTLTVLEPVLIALIGGFVLLVTLSVLLPVISLNRLIG
jgi:type II secretory pathway component PulF